MPRDEEPQARTVDSAAAQVVRLALFHEYRHAPLKRPAIKAVIPNGINFNTVFAAAQKTLASTFGMELVELRQRLKGDVAEERAEEVRQARQTQAHAQATQTQRPRHTQADDEEDEEEVEGEKNKGKKTGRKGKTTGSYILRNILPREIVAAMAVPAPLPAFDPEDAAYTETLAEDSGALIPWEKTDVGSSIELLGIRSVILCMVLAMGRSADDLRLMSMLRRIGLQRETVLPFGSADSHHDLMTVEKYLDYLAKQNYLEKLKVANPSAPDGFSIEWRWGSREVEFSEEAGLALLGKFFLNPDSSGEDTDSDTDQLRQNQNQRQRGRGTRRQPRTAEQKKARFERKFKALRGNVERSAGGALVGEL